MKEVTRIATIEITAIGDLDDDLSGFISKEELKQVIRDHIIADHVEVTNIQDFIRDVDEQCENGGVK